MENHHKHSLGRRAFFLFLSRRIKSAIILFLIAGVVFLAERYSPPSYLPWVAYADMLLFLISCAWLVFLLVQTYLEYRFFTYMFTEEAFIMTYGYMVRTEVAALYHQIQNVNIYRSMGDRFAGVSKVIIFMTGNEKDSPHNKIVLPSVDKHKAKLVQKELLSRARRHFGALHPDQNPS